MNTKQKKLLGLAKVIMITKSEDELVKLLDDLITESELERIHERVKIVACLKDGMSQRETQRETDAAIATVGRGAKMMQKSKLILDKIISTAQKTNWWYKLFWRT